MKWTQKTETPATDNPYLNARREWNERYGDYIATAYAWRLTAIVALGITAIAVVGLVWMGSQSRLIPYVVAVDKLGDAVAIRRADVAARPDSRILRAQLARWIHDVRSVYVDAGAERYVLKEAYAMVNRRGAAYSALNDYFRNNDPFERAKQETVGVEVESVLPISGETWRVEWREERRSRDGSLMSRQQWQASLSIGIHPPVDEASLLVNPMGVYIHSFSWSQRL